ncbi:MAG: family 78 glycoside hydrolase catalytic domain, partial [Clostridia bacterium]|nr:family 78 glycoside hydrolase catalytic domain [Clostridia bacterium]
MKRHLNSKWISVPESIRPYKISGSENWDSSGKYDSFRLPNDDRGLSYFAREFSVNKVGKAFVSASSLGVFELYINGRRVGCEENGETVFDELKPGWTEYRKRVMYYTYDVTSYIKEGKNLFIAAVAPGWYNGRISYRTYGASNHVAFISEITIDDANGMRTIGTDRSWKAGFGGAVRTADIWEGEIYDASLTPPEEITPETEELNWSEATEEEHDIEITPKTGPSVRIRKGIAPQPMSVNYIDRIEDNGTDFGKGHVYRSEISEEIIVKEGERVVIDFGQNHVGFPTFSAYGSEGTQLFVRFGEMLNDSGLLSRGNDGAENTVYSENYRTAAAKIVVKPNGKKTDLRPLMTFFGYRYIELTSVGEICVTGLRTNVVGSDIEETGHIVTS